MGWSFTPTLTTTGISSDFCCDRERDTVCDLHKRKQRMKQSCPLSYSSQTLTEKSPYSAFCWLHFGIPPGPHCLALTYSSLNSLLKCTFLRFPRLTQFPCLAHTVIFNYAFGWQVNLMCFPCWLQAPWGWGQYLSAPSLELQIPAAPPVWEWCQAKSS